jgi:hypothetical protein
MVEATNRTIFAAVKAQKEKCQIPPNLYAQEVNNSS